MHLFNKYNYDALSVLQEQTSKEDIEEWRKLIDDLCYMRGFDLTEEPSNQSTEKVQKALELLERQRKAISSLCTVQRVRSAEKGLQSDAAYQMAEHSLFALALIIRVLEDHPTLVESYMEEFFIDSPPTTESSLVALRYVGRCLERLIGGETPTDAFHLRGKRGSSPKTPENEQKKRKKDHFRCSVALMVYVVRQNNKTKAEDSFLEVAEFFRMDNKENTIKHWYRKYLTTNKQILDTWIQVINA